MDYRTLVMPTGKDGNYLLVLTNIVIIEDTSYPVFKDIRYAQPMYLSKFDLEHIFGRQYLSMFNLWDIEDIESTIEHCD